MSMYSGAMFQRWKIAAGSIYLHTTMSNFMLGYGVLMENSDAIGNIFFPSGSKKFHIFRITRLRYERFPIGLIMSIAVIRSAFFP